MVAVLGLASRPMIIDFDALAALEGAVTMVDGGFDPIHDGHVAYFAFAAALGLPVLCNVASDAYVAGKHPVLLPQPVRARVLDALRDLAYVHVSDHRTVEILERLRPRFFVKGEGWKGRLPAVESEACARHGVEVVFAPTAVNSSTSLVRALCAPAERLAAYESFVLAQESVSADAYGRDYFHEAWRANASDYSLESRRAIEGRNPQLIKDVFEPRAVLDMGCGPGALMALLHEIGIEADGVDFAPSSRDLAPEIVRSRISVGRLDDPTLPPDRYDLVICREVFEHLTVLQTQQVVQTMCRVTSRFVYATARFHPDPASLFDSITEFEVDPTHVNLQNIDMLRLMFVLQGMGRRPDLEARMDWQNKGRVLVYEKARAGRGGS